MRKSIILICAALFACSAASVGAQQAATLAPEPVEQRVAITEQPVALDASGRVALAARLRTTALNGTVESPVMNVRLVIENRSQFFYTFGSGWVTFYDSEGVRCGEGLFNVNALAPGESAETDAPGLRLKCAPTTWRIVATNLIARTSDAIKPMAAIVTDQSSQEAATASTTAPVPPLEISIDGEVLPLQLGKALNIDVGSKKRINIVVNAAP